MSRSVSIQLQPVSVESQDSETGSINIRSSRIQDGLAEDQGSRQGFSLPPADGGKDAYFFLAACFMSEALVWGAKFTFPHF